LIGDCVTAFLQTRSRQPQTPRQSRPIATASPASNCRFAASCWRRDRIRVSSTRPSAAQPAIRQDRPCNLSKHRSDLGPKRGPFAIAIRLRWCRLCGADRIGCRKTVDQTGFQFRVGVAVRRCGFARIGGMPVVRRRIECLSHGLSPSKSQRLGTPDVPNNRSGTSSGGVRTDPGRAHEFGAQCPETGIEPNLFCTMPYIAQTNWRNLGSNVSSMRLHPHRACDAPKTKFRSQPVWNFAFGAPGRPDRQAGGLCEKV